MNRFFEWLISEAGAGWVFGIVSVTGLALTLLLRKRATRVVCSELERSSLLSVPHTIRDGIAVTYYGEKVESLSDASFELFNAGSDVVRNASVTIVFDERTRVIGAAFDDDPSSPTASADTSPHVVELTIPYLNADTDHKHRLRLLVLCDGPANVVRVEGSGAGWSTHFQRLPTEGEMRLRLMTAIAILLVLGVGVAAVAVRTGSIAYGQGKEVGPELLGIALGLVVVMGAALYWISRQERLIRRMGLKRQGQEDID